MLHINIDAWTKKTLKVKKGKEAQHTQKESQGNNQQNKRKRSKKWSKYHLTKAVTPNLDASALKEATVGLLQDISVAIIIYKKMFDKIISINLQENLYECFVKFYEPFLLFIDIIFTLYWIGLSCTM